MVLTFTELKALCPQSFSELSCEVFENIFSQWELDKEEWERDYMKLFSILTNTPYKFSEPTREKEAIVYELTKWVTDEEVPYKRELPKTITISGKEVEIPTDVASLSIGQNIILKQLISKTRYVEESLSMATAIYLQPLLDGKFDYVKAKELREQIKTMKAEEVYPVGFFLLNHVKENGWKRASFWSLTLTSLKAKVIRMLPGWLRSAVFTDTQTFRL